MLIFFHNSTTDPSKYLKLDSEQLTVRMQALFD